MIPQILFLFQCNRQITPVDSHTCPLPEILSCRPKFHTIKSNVFCPANLSLHNLGPPYCTAPFLTISYSSPTTCQNTCKILCHFMLSFAHALSSAWTELPLPFCLGTCGVIEIEKAWKTLWLEFELITLPLTEPEATRWLLGLGNKMGLLKPTPQGCFEAWK